jgi:hypothetical protein
MKNSNEDREFDFLFWAIAPIVIVVASTATGVLAAAIGLAVKYWTGG